GLRTLTVIQSAVDSIEETTGQRIDISRIDDNDKAVFDYISSGKTEGVFQLESAGMKNFMKELKPATLEDIIAGIALYRPGPMQFIPQYVKSKNSGEKVEYLCPQLEPILSPTYGCIVYQEQVMQIVRDLGGYSMGRSDLVRRAMSKKKQSVMEKERANFIYGNQEEGVPGCIANGVSEQVGNRIYDEMMSFAEYAFNKGHSASYAVITYRTAWLKYYYPVQFMAALLTSVIDSPGKVAEYIMCCRNMGIAILPPDINRSGARFSVEGKSVRYALLAVKGVGRPAIEFICRERAANGSFASLQDFLTRTDGSECNRRMIEHFIKAGAMDCLPGNRRQFMEMYVPIMEQLAVNKKNHIAGQMTLMDLLGTEEKEEFEIAMPDLAEYSKEELLSMEKAVLGIYVSGHPLESYEKLWKRNVTAVTSDFVLDEETQKTALEDGSTQTIGGLINEKNVKYTRREQPMAFLQLEDMYGTVEVVVFPKTYEKYGGLLEQDAKIFVTGRVSLEEDKNGKLISEKIVPFSQVGGDLWLRFDTMEQYQKSWGQIEEILKGSEGPDRVVIYIAEGKLKKTLPGKDNVRADEELMSALYEKMGKSNVKIV
ncbi:MAG: DNA polymerase III subunit alpha, partial [Lachnospiraceae bacterium]|nr:DNA polymerase III subunit alpha [Lachnospiraceae bacterium]